MSLKLSVDWSMFVEEFLHGGIVCREEIIVVCWGALRRRVKFEKLMKLIRE